MRVSEAKYHARSPARSSTTHVRCLHTELLRRRARLSLCPQAPLYLPVTETRRPRRFSGQASTSEGLVAQSP